MHTCDKCKGTMLLERAVDMDAGLAITVFACLNCGRRKAVDSEPRPLTARH
jgi:DNA-directed RNA polymerase subunit M/transcription elongation factor TFIIS